MTDDSTASATRRNVLVAALAVIVAAVVGFAVLDPGGDDRISSPPPATDEPVATVTVAPAPIERPGLADAELAEFRPNELGVIPVLEYHLIEPGENSEFSRTPETFRADLEWLVENEYVPIRFRDLTSGHFDVPAGKKPVVLTFDDSSIGQFRVLGDGSIDPASAMGIMIDVAAMHPEFPAVATFFPLLDVDVDSRILWGQPASIDAKLATIIELGGEVGSHTVSHERLDLADPERVEWQLATSVARLQERIGTIDGEPYEIVSLALPLGTYPSDESLLRSGSADGQDYEFTGAAEVAGGPTASPFSTAYDAFHIDRTQAIDGYLDGVFADLLARPDLSFVSDGDPEVITVPTESTLADEQRGSLAEPSRSTDTEVVRYDRTP